MSVLDFNQATVSPESQGNGESKGNGVSLATSNGSNGKNGTGGNGVHKERKEIEGWALAMVARQDQLKLCEKVSELEKRIAQLESQQQGA